MSDPTLANRQPISRATQPISRATGSMGDISPPILSFHWLEPVYFKTHDTSFLSQSPEIMGYFVGFSDNVGHLMTYKIWNKATNKILDRSAVRSAKTPNVNLKASSPKSKLDPTSSNSPDMPQDQSKKGHIFSKIIGNGPNSSNGEPKYLDEPTEGEGTSTDQQDVEEDFITQPIIKIKDGEYSTIKIGEDGIPVTDAIGEYIYIKRIDPATIVGRKIKCKQDDSTILILALTSTMS